MERKPFEHFGVVVLPMRRNSWGGRWEMRMQGNVPRMATETKEDMKQHIRDYVRGDR